MLLLGVPIPRLLFRQNNLPLDLRSGFHTANSNSFGEGSNSACAVKDQETALLVGAPSPNWHSPDSSIEPMRTSFWFETRMNYYLVTGVDVSDSFTH